MVSQVLDQELNLDSNLHRAVAEDLKVPLIRILALLEYNKISNCSDTGEIELISEAALKMVDSYALSAQLCNSQASLLYEPVAMKSVIYDCQSSLKGFANLQGVVTNLNIQRHTGLAVANRQIVKSIICSLAYSMLTITSVKPKQSLSYSLTKSKNKIDVGIFSSFNNFEITSLNKIRSNYGRVKQVIPEIVQGATAGIVIADKLCEKLNTKLSVSKYQDMTGLVFSLNASSQMSLV